MSSTCSARALFSWPRETSPSKVGSPLPLPAPATSTSRSPEAPQDENALLRQILQESDEARGLNEEIRSGNGSPELPLALGELVSQEVQERQDQLAAGVLDALRGFAREERSSQATGNEFLNVSFLVKRDNEKSFLSAEQDLAKEVGEDFSLRLHGPLPAYSFA
ncbi:GvpL/GvpF family gas vesicle protein [Streptomyces sp900116325]|uniref:GvpL/GvpF family gas vesicle protein n=1 Tax=Streptomyces sp. 900116325 TaxID=3154295 RepID=UPI00340B4AF5